MSGCRGCRGAAVGLAVDLGEQCPSDAFPAGDEPDPPAGPLQVGVCQTCGLVQTITEQPAPPRESLSAPSAAQRSAFDGLARALAARGWSGAVAVTGHHADTLTEALRDAGDRVTTGATIVVDHVGLAHDDDLDAAVAALAASAAEDAVVVLDIHHALAILQRGHFDVLSHEHRTYLSVTALVPVLRRHGLNVVDVERLTLYDGTVRLWCERRGAPTAAVDDLLAEERAGGVGERERWRMLDEIGRRGAGAFAEFVRDAVGDGRSVAGYGAPSRASVLLQLAGVGAHQIPFTVDASPAKHGRRVPGTGIPIRPIETLAQERPDFVVLFPYDVAEEIVLARTEVREWGGRFVIPLPEVRVS